MNFIFALFRFLLNINTNDLHEVLHMTFGPSCKQIFRKKHVSDTKYLYVYTHTIANLE